MKLFRKLRTWAGICVVFVVGVFGYVYLATGGASDAANSLFARIAAGEVRGAYEDTAPVLQEVQSFEEFEAAASTLGLDQFAGASWNNRQVSGDRAVLSGTVTLTDGSAVPLAVTLVEVEEGWQVVSFTGQAGSGMVGGGLAPLPDVDEARTLTQASLGSLSQALQQSDFTDFHASAAELWQAQHTAAEIQSIFQPYLDAGETLSGIEALEPQFSSPPARDAEGALMLVGYVAQPDSTLRFQLRFFYEHPEWRLGAITVELVPVTEQSG